MKRSFSKLLQMPLALLVLASFALVPAGEAAARAGGGGGCGGGGGGGGARAQAAGGGGGGAHAQAAGGGGGARQTAQVNNSKADARTNNVRNTSVNNVNNVNKNVNVNVQGNSGGWDNDYHPVGAAVAVGATVAVTSAIVGSMVRTVPPGCVPVNYSGMVYQQCGTTWYQPQGSQYVVVNPPY